MAANDEEAERLAAAKRALGGLKNLGGAKKPAGEPKKAETEDGEPVTLQKLIEAMKQGSTPISAVEPEGYALLERVRAEGPITDAASPQTIEALQRALKRARCTVEETGYFDDATVAAVQQFQKQNGLPSNGLFDAKTLDAMDKYFGIDRGAAAGEAPRSTAGRSMYPETGNAFLDSVVPGAVQGMHQHGVPASVSMAMAVLESQWGERPIARDLNNLFALKGKGPAGSAYYKEDGTPGGSTEFKRFAKPAESVAEHARLMAESGQYAAAMSHRDRADNFARALSGVYSPNPMYGSLLTRIMKQFDLYRFDRIQPS